MAPSEQTVNVPQLLIVVLLGGLAIRYFFFSPASSSSATGGRNGANSRAREQDVETIQQMFPQVSRRSIMWDLQRNGGSVAATTERILSGRGLENPPQSFQPLPPPTPLSSSSTTTSSSAGSKSLLPDLITRYNLQSKIATQPGEQRQEEPEIGKKKQGQAWSQNKGERQALLQKRREEMILSARRKMEEKLAKEKEAAAPVAEVPSS